MKPLFDGFFPAEIISYLSPRVADFKLHDDQHNLDSLQQEFLENELNVALSNVVTIRQVHGDRIVVAKKEYLNKNLKAQEADAIITQEKNLAICVRTADCVPLFVYDSQAQAIGVIHAGWKGTKLNIAGKTISLIKSLWNSDVSNIKVALGPSIRPCCYEVTDEFKEIFPHDLKKVNGKMYLDLVAVNKRQLFEEGIELSNIIEDGGCTVCQSHWHSFRRDKDQSGRIISLMMIRRLA